MRAEEAVAIDSCILALAVAAGFYIKGISGLGEAIPIVGIGAWVLTPTELVVVVALLDLAGGILAVGLADGEIWDRSDWPYLTPLLLGIVAGTALLTKAPSSGVDLIFVILLFAVAALIVHRSLLTSSPAPATYIVGRSFFSLYAGFSGGLTGIDGPPLAEALYRGRGLVDVRQQLMRLLVYSAVFRVGTLLAARAVTVHDAVVALLLLPVAGASFIVSRNRHPRISATKIAQIIAICSVGSATFALMRWS